MADVTQYEVERRFLIHGISARSTITVSEDQDVLDLIRVQVAEGDAEIVDFVLDPNQAKLLGHVLQVVGEDGFRVEIPGGFQVKTPGEGS